jgi:hypothetical protein
MTENFRWFGDKVNRKITARAEIALEKVAILTTNTAKLSMTEPKSGEPVPPGQGSRGGHPWVKRQRSAEGEPPAVQTGQLRASITHIRPAPLVRFVGTNVKHGLFTEVGTSRMAARPWLRPAFERNKDKLARFMKGAV